ncbi:MAG: hypothetical protein QM539_08320, partial [Alphaproteobacteria bacterium]|nr:hypothetical protein [Alphaproteobacteria bacterium]
MENSIYKSLENINDESLNVESLKKIFDDFKSTVENKNSILDILREIVNEVHQKELETYLNNFEVTLDLNCLNNIKNLCINKFGFEKKNLKECVNHLHKVSRFPILPYYFLYNFDKELKEHVVIPIWYSFLNDSKYKYLIENIPTYESRIITGLYTISPEKYLNESVIQYYSQNKPEQLNLKFEEYLDNLIKYIILFTMPIVELEYYGKDFKKNLDQIKKNSDQIKKNLDQIKKTTLIATIAQIFARNFAHNLGSHVSIRSTNVKIKERIYNL